MSLLVAAAAAAAAARGGVKSADRMNRGSWFSRLPKLSKSQKWLSALLAGVLVLLGTLAWKFRELLINPISRGIIVEALFSLILLVFVSIKVLGYKRPLTPKRAIITGSLVTLFNLVLLVLEQEWNSGLYLGTAGFLLAPVVWTWCIALDPPSGKKGDLWRAAIVLVCSAVWMLAFWQLGMILHNYVTMLSVPLVLLPAFQCWRGNEEGFIRPSFKQWYLAVGVLCVFFTATILMAAAGWDGIMVSRYAKQLQWVLPISMVIFFLAKAIPEELIFRGVFQGLMKDKFGFAAAWFSSAFVFGLCALNSPAAWAFPNWRAAVSAAMLGLGCGWVYHKTRSLAVSGAVNAIVSFSWWFVFQHGGA